MAHVLMAYGTRQGHTKIIADRISAALRAAGHNVDETDLRQSPRPRPEAYDAVVVGASVHARGFEREVRKWVRENVRALDRRPNAFFSVSMTSSVHDERHDAEIGAVIDEFVRDTGWKPSRIERFAGALEYSKYNWLMKRIMRRIVKREDARYTDTSRDYDFTDYDDVATFANEFATSLSTSSHT